MVSAQADLEVRVGCEFAYEADDAPTPAIVIVRPDEASRVLAEAWATDPRLAVHDYVDVYGNRCRRLTIPPGTTTLRYDARVTIPSEPDAADPSAPVLLVEDLPDETLLYTLPSRFCLSDELSDRAWELFGATPPTWERVRAICDWVHGRLAFAYGSSRPVTTARDALEAGTGVCRDFAHLAVTFCRAMSIPARYVFGYLPDIGVPPPGLPMDFCAWFEAYLGDRWWTFDPRNNERRIGHIVIARGRDALDVAMITTYGGARLKRMTVWADHLDNG
ncbi:MAG TPA: transglutaminase family protein [Candidatus Baltobacteraceae bacterium]|nr:transglutaminase family protein [Candidatus Baltobacteraceae bacterium]